MIFGRDDILFLVGIAAGYAVFTIFGPSFIDFLTRLFWWNRHATPPITLRLGLDNTGFKAAAERATRALVACECTVHEAIENRESKIENPKPEAAA